MGVALLRGTSVRTAAGLLTALVACSGCVRPAKAPPASVPAPVEQLVVRPDAGPVTAHSRDAGWNFPEQYAGEPCSAEAWATFAADDAGAADLTDGGVVTLGLCIALRGLNAQALLNGAPVQGLVKLHWAGGGFDSEIEQAPDSSGFLPVKVMRGRFDELKYQPAGVFPTWKGFMDYGPIDMTRDQERRLAVKSHLLRGSATFGGLPFTPWQVPPDIHLEANGLPQAQWVDVVSTGGSYQVSLLEGTFALFLSSPPQALFGSELRSYLVNRGTNVQLDGDQAVDIQVPTRTLEGSITIDGQPFPDRRVGPDYRLEFTVPGDREPTVVTHHEGGLAGYASLIPQGVYAVTMNFEQASDRHLPSQVFNQQLSQYLDMSHDNTLSAAFTTFTIEGGLTVDGQPVPPNPAYDLNFYMYGFAGATSTQNGLIYEVPLTSSSFNLRAFPGQYFVILQIDDNLGEDLPTGWYVVDRYLQVHGDTRMPIDLVTNTYSGRLLVDGQPPPEGQIAGELLFRNRDLNNGRDSLYRRKLRCAADGSFRVRLPLGAYEVYFSINNDVFPEYATGRQLMIARLDMSTPQAADLQYDTVLVTGPLRVAGAIVADSIGGPEAGLSMTRQSDFGQWVWEFEGGRPDYRLRLPRGDYALDFVIHPHALDGVAWGNGPLGVQLTARRPDDPLAVQ